MKVKASAEWHILKLLQGDPVEGRYISFLRNSPECSMALLPGHPDALTMIEARIQPEGAREDADPPPLDTRFLAFASCDLLCSH